MPVGGESWLAERIKRICSAVTTVAVTLVVILAVLLAGVRIFGLSPYVVLSGSMEPEYPVGSMIYTKKASPQEFRVNDPITFLINPQTVATHRIIEIIPDPDDSSALRFRTKGDANDIPDGGSVHQNNVIGKPVFCIPLLGYVASYIQNPPGRYVALATGVALVLIAFFPDMLSTGMKQREDKNNEEESL